jgi:putative hemolysin
VLSRVGAPVVWLLEGSTRVILRLLRIRPGADNTVTEEEIKSLIAEGTEAGVFERAEQHMIEGVLRLADRSAESIMTPRIDVVWLDLGRPLEELHSTMTSSGHSRFPACRASIDEVVGVVQAKDLADSLMVGRTVDLEALIKEVLIVHNGTPVLKLMELFRAAPVHMAVVVDEYGSFEGVVTPSDILGAIAGDLPAPGDDETPEALRLDDGSWLVDGMMHIGDVERVLGLKGMSTGDYHTLAGFVLWRFGHVPKVAESFEWNGHVFRVVDLDGRRIDKVAIAPVAPEPADPVEVFD